MKDGMKQRVALGLCLAVCGLLLSAAALPDVQYTTVTKVKMGGAMGKVIGAFARLGGAPEAYTETAYVQGNRMRTDSEEGAHIIDLDGERFITLNHKKKTYTVVTFAQLRQQIEQAAADAQGQGQAGSTDTPEGEPQESNTEVKVDFKVERTGQRATVNAFDAERVIMTITAEAVNKAPADSEEQGLEGTMVFVSEMWLSEAVKGYEEVEAFHRKMAEKMGEEMMKTSGGADLAATMQSAYANDPRMAEGMRKAAEEAAKLEGVSLKTTTYIVLVPPGMTYQPELLFTAEAAGEEKEEKKEEKKKKGGLGGFARRVAEQAAAATTPEEKEEGEETPQQATVVTMTNEMKDLSTTTLQASLFEIPSGYKEVPAP